MSGPRRIAFINEKGGTCKTTLAVNVAAFLALKQQRRVLLVDLDTQGHAGKALGVDVRELRPNVFHVLTDPSVTVEAASRPTPVPNLTLLPSCRDMADFPVTVASAPDRERLLAKRLAAPFAQSFDAIVFDAPPSLGLVSTNILLAADEVVIPVATTYLALDGCAEMARTVEQLRDRAAHERLRVSLVVPTLYRKSALADEVLGTLQQHFPGKVTEPLALNVAIDEAQSHGKTIWEYAPWSRGATMLQAIAERIADARA